jgi:superfamily II DNA or RNA helicase
MLKLEVGNYNTKIVGADALMIAALRADLKYENDIHVRRQTAIRVYGSADMLNRVERYVYMVSKSGVFLTGLLKYVELLLSKRQVPYEVVDNREKIKLDSDFVIRQINRLPLEPRDYQIDAIFDCLESGRGIIHAATGAGKTVILSALAFIYNLPTLIVVERIDLAKQLMQEIIDYTGETDVGMIGDGVFKPGKITVGMVQSLQKRKGKSTKKRDAMQEFLDGIKILIVDEAHHVQASSYQKVLASCPNASVRFGCTATPMTSKIVGEGYIEQNRDIELKAFLGPIIYKKTTKDLIKEGYLAEPTVYIVRNELYNDGVRLEYNEEYERILMTDEVRNKAVCSIIATAYNKGERVIGFVRRIQHGEDIADMLASQYGIPRDAFAFVNGALDKATRAAYLDGFKRGKLQILFGTVLKEGLNFHCDVGINMAAGETAIDAIQRLGRVLRKSKDPVTGDVDITKPEYVVYYDFEDCGHPWFAKHAKKRITTYIQEGHVIKYCGVKDI